MLRVRPSYSLPFYTLGVRASFPSAHSLLFSQTHYCGLEARTPKEEVVLHHTAPSPSFACGKAFQMVIRVAKGLGDHG